MLDTFLKFIQAENLFNPDERILLTVSGGMDSSLMAWLFHKAGFSFGIAHCNFGLRGIESDGDELFVKDMAARYKVPFYSTYFETGECARETKISIQMAARKLRYDFFMNIMNRHNYAYIATAHHKDDEVETYFINLFRGTGISGLTGYVPASGNIIKPLLFATRDEIKEFVTKNNIKYREDSSNISGTYIRNAIRNRLIPIAKELYPDATGSVARHMKRLRGVEQIYRSHLDEVKKELVREQDDIIKIDIEKLLSFQNPELYLFELLYPYGFSGDIISAILKTAGKQAGKVFFSETHRVLKDRNCFLISAIPTRQQFPGFHVNAGDPEISSPLLMRFAITDAADNASFICAENRAYFDFDKISFPLTIRKWKAGDYMYPFGLKGRKKLVDVFKDHKLSLIEKENIWLLCNKNDIIWVIGLRSDNRYRVSAKTRKVFSAEWCR